MSNNISNSAVLYQVWKRGLLTYKMDTFQKEVFEQIIKSDEKVHVIVCSRRLGKTFLASVMAVMQCLMKPNSIVKFVSPTKLQLNSNIRPLLKQILEDCPEDFHPAVVKSQYTYYFQNGSELHLAGSNGGHAEKLRGSFSNLCIVDEAQDCSELTNLVRSILIPTTINTKGKIILIATPPKDSEHEFLTFMEEADKDGTLIKKTIYDNPRITQDEIQTIIDSYPGGADHPDFRREFKCEIIKDPTLSVLPEFTDSLEKEITKECIKPPFYDAYVSMDVGFVDMTVLLFAYYDFRQAKLVIQDEIAIKGLDVQIPKVAELIRLKEKELWTDPLTNETRKPKLRVSDISYIFTEEIYRESGKKISFEIARKDDKDAAINNLRVLLENKKIIISPKCQTLLRHLRNVKWSKRKNVREFSHSPDGSHYDAVDALVYLVRHTDFNHNPYPKHYGMGFQEQDLFIADPRSYNAGITSASTQLDVFKKIFKVSEGVKRKDK